LSGQTHRDLNKRFLLGELSEGEQNALEERFFEDDAVFEELQIAQEELIELYLDDRLNAEDRAKFERRFGSSKKLQERVVFAKILADKVAVALPTLNQTPAPAPTWTERLFGSFALQRPAFRMALVAALVIVVFGSIAWFVRKSRLEAERFEAQRVEDQQKLKRQLDEMARNADAERQVRHSPTPTPTASPSETVIKPSDTVKLALVTIIPGGSRSTTGSINKLVIDGGNERARLTFILEDTSYTNYHFEFRGTQSERNFSSEAQLKKGSKQIAVELPVAHLPPDDYTIKVFGVANGTREPIGDYTLFVRRK